MTNDDPVPFHCPSHGHVQTASPKVLVEHGWIAGTTEWCGQSCAPEGTTPSDHRRSYMERRRARRAMRNIRASAPASQADSASAEAPVAGAPL